MEVVCGACGHRGPAGAVQVRGSEVRVSCGACGHEQPLIPEGPSDPGALAGRGSAAVALAQPLAQGGDASAPEALRAASAARSTTGSDPGETRGDDGDSAGPVDAGSVVLPPVKCPKCAHRQHEGEACERCGLVFANVRPGQMPWERVTPGQESAWRTARELWASVEASPRDAGRHGRLVEHAIGSGVTDATIRLYRHRLADHPDEAETRAALQRLVDAAHATVRVMATGQGRDVVAQAQRFRRGMTIGVAVLCAVAVILLFRMMFRGMPTP